MREKERDSERMREKEGESKEFFIINLILCGLKFVNEILFSFENLFVWV